MSDLDYFSGNSSISMPGSNTSGFDLVGAITNAFSPSSSGSSNWSGANLTQAPTLGFGLGGNDGYSGVQVGNGGFSFGAGLFPNTEVVNVGGATVAGDKVVVQGLRDYASSNSPEDVALIVGGLLAAGLLVSSIGGGAAPSGTVEVKAKGPTAEPPPAEPPPAEPPPAEPPPAEPPPVVVPPPANTPAPDTPTPETSPNPTEDELIKAGISKELIPLLLKYGLPALASYLSYKDAANAREEARGWSSPGGYAKQAVRSPGGGVTFKPAGKAAGGIASLAGGGNVIGEKSAATPYQVYDKASDTYRYVDAAGYEKWLSGIPLTPINRVQGSPVYYGAPSKAEGDYDIGGYNPITMQDNSLDMQDFDESFNKDTFFQAYYNNLYAPEGLIANEVVNRAVEELPSTFDARNIALRNERDAMMRNATNQFLGDVMSVDQITGDIDPIQSLRNIAAYEPSTIGAAPGISGLVPLMRGLDPYSEEAQKGFGSSYIEQLSPTDIQDIRSGGNNYRNILGAISDVLENKSILPADYSDSQPPIIKSKPLSEMGVTDGGGEKRGGVVHRSHYAAGGMTTKQPFYLGGPTDGMADEVPAHIDNKRPAALSDGEFVIPADVVSHLGNGNSNAGAKRLYEMMDNIREARTGNKNQGIQINPNQFMPR